MATEHTLTEADWRTDPGSHVLPDRNSFDNPGPGTVRGIEANTNRGAGESAPEVTGITGIDQMEAAPSAAGVAEWPRFEVPHTEEP